MKIAFIEDIYRLDKAASEDYGISPLILMENAALSLYKVIRDVYGLGLNVLVMAGPGNNGGDGLALARILHSNGYRVKIYLLANPGRYRGEARRNYLIARRIGIEMVGFRDSLRMIDADLNSFDILVDGIFGVGLAREITGQYRDIIEKINASDIPVVSIDIPSGVNGDTGGVMGIAVKADQTVTFGLPKPGHFLYPGAEYVGELYLSHISYPRRLIEDDSLWLSLNTPVDIPGRRRDTHKGDYGRTLFIAGSRRYMGAPYFASYTYILAGGGLSYLATVRSITRNIASRAPEVIYLPLDETSEGSISRGNLDYLIEKSSEMDFVVIGPGITLNEETAELTLELIRGIDKPILIDGDGLTIASRNVDVLRDRRAPTILTPHPGEMSRLTGLSINDVRSNRIGVAREFSIKHGVIVVLKGANTIISYPDGSVYINTSGNPGMATAGSGDVLSGLIPALYGIGLRLDDAVRMGVFIHGVAGDLASDRYGLEGVTATRIMYMVPKAINYVRDNMEEIRMTYYNSLRLV